MQSTDFLKSYPQLESYLAGKGYDIARIKLPKVDHPFPLMIPKYYADLINWYDAFDPLRLMVVTDQREKDIKSYEVADPIGDNHFAPVPGIIHRYPDRCLLMLTNACAVHCRFCFRKSLLHEKHANIQQCLAYIRSHPEIWEVIFSGGDPFVLTDHVLQSILVHLREIPHVKMIRFHTRTPAVYPARITPSFVHILSKANPINIVIHINHPREITPEFSAVARMMAESGTMLLSQTVLMKGVNDDPKVLTDLFKGLLLNRVKPYYLHHLDPAEGTHHFRVSIQKGKEIMRALRGHISGTCLPEYVVETENGGGKIPVFWLQTENGKDFTGKTFRGKEIRYCDEITSLTLNTKL